ncbi:MAG: hypothetical protein NTW66_04135 [Candidatus Magasanikbacteria bacterium]|nr:hypothetical protein [Candidatus Magasanikbacteria bacterium]
MTTQRVSLEKFTIDGPRGETGAAELNESLAEIFREQGEEKAVFYLLSAIKEAKEIDCGCVEGGHTLYSDDLEVAGRTSPIAIFFVLCVEEASQIRRCVSCGKSFKDYYELRNHAMFLTVDAGGISVLTPGPNDIRAFCSYLNKTMEDFCSRRIDHVCDNGSFIDQSDLFCLDCDKYDV